MRHVRAVRAVRVFPVLPLLPKGKVSMKKQRKRAMADLTVLLDKLAGESRSPAYPRRLETDRRQTRPANSVSAIAPIQQASYGVV